MPTFSQRHVLLLASYIIIFGGLLLVLPLKLLPSLLAGLLVFELVNMLTPQLQRLIEGRRARWLAVALLGTLIVSVLTLIFAGAISFLLHEAETRGLPRQIHGRGRPRARPAAAVPRRLPARQRR